MLPIDTVVLPELLGLGETVDETTGDEDEFIKVLRIVDWDVIFEVETVEVLWFCEVDVVEELWGAELDEEIVEFTTAGVAA